ncbi:MAG: methionine/alanine import family NSS transporter small subunit [Georgenia sp.]
MTTVAIIMMIVAITLVWGGLFVAIRFLLRHPLDPTDETTAILDGDEDADLNW